MSAGAPEQPAVVDRDGSAGSRVCTRLRSDVPGDPGAAAGSPWVRIRRHRPQSALLALFVAGYVLGAALAHWLSLNPGTDISLWAPAGLFLATLVLSPVAAWPWWLVAGAAAEGTANALWFHNPLPAAGAMYAGNALCAAAGAGLIALARGGSPLRAPDISLRDLLSLVVGGALLAPTLAATVGAATLALAEGQPFARAWLLWWVGDATGVLLTAPLVLVAAQAWVGRARWTRARSAEAVLVGAVLLAVAVPSLSGQVPFAFLSLLPLVWAAVRFRFAGAVLGLGALAVLATGFTGAGLGPFVADRNALGAEAGAFDWPQHRFVVLQVFLGVSAIIALLVATLTTQHRQALAVLESANDALERRVAERTAELAQSERRFSALADSLPVVVWVTDIAGRIEFVNREYERFFGVSEAQARAGNWRVLVHPDDEPAYAEAFAAAQRERRPFEATARVRRADGEWRTVASLGVPRWSEGGDLLGMVGSSLDITERQRSEDALAEASRQKDEFLAMLAHELRNPLAPIRNAAALLGLADGTPAAVQSVGAMIERQVAHMVRLVDDLLDVSRVSRGQITLERSPVDLSELAGQAVEAHRARGDARRHRIELSLPDMPVVVRGDVTRLAQVIGNLVTNAAKYTEPGGLIEIAVRALDDGATPVAEVSVRDDGRGIAPEALPHVFEMFFQEHSTLDRAEGGLGIGLALVKRLVEMHDGSVRAASAGRGRGSTFSIRLPRVPAPGAADARPGCKAKPSPSHRRVLVVDDNRDAADSTAELLRLDGHEVKVAYDGQAAVAAALADEPDAVLLDLGLPLMDGYEACHAMRAGGLERTLIVALTGYGQDHDQRASRGAGFDAHLVKPLDPDALRGLFARPRAARPRGGRHTPPGRATLT